MHIIMVSSDNSKICKVGGKHIHQELLETGLKESGITVSVVYINRKRSFSQRVISCIERNISDLFEYRQVVSYVMGIVNRLRRAVDKQMLNYTDDSIFLAEDVLAACAIGREAKAKGIEVKLVLTLHGYFARESQNYNNYSGGNVDRIFENNMKWEQEAMIYADELIVVDTNLKQYAKDKLFYTKPIHVVYNAINTNQFFPPSSEEIQIARGITGIIGKAPVLLVARRLVKKNGVIYALEAAKILETSSISFQMIIVGDGPEGRALRDFAKDNNLSCVRFVGEIPHEKVDSYYKLASIIILPSTRSDDVEEATSLSMLEGMACGKPVVATAIGGLKDVISSGYNGYLVPDKSPQVLARQIEEILFDTKGALRVGRTAADYVAREHGYVRHARKIIDILSVAKKGAVVDKGRHYT